MAYSADSFVADEQPTTTKWNKLWSNDAALRDGSGVQWANNQNINAENSGGTAKQLIRLSSDNYARYGQWPRQTDDSNSSANGTIEDVLIQHGWFQDEGPGATTDTTNITFPVQFTTVPIVFLTVMGADTNVATQISDLQSPQNDMKCGADNITTSGFRASWGRTSTMGVGAYYAFAWLAIGTKT